VIARHFCGKVVHSPANFQLPSRKSCTLFLDSNDRSRSVLDQEFSTR